MAETTEEQLNKPGDVKVDELFITLSNGENYDLMPFFVELNLYEEAKIYFFYFPDICTSLFSRIIK